MNRRSFVKLLTGGAAGIGAASVLAKTAAPVAPAAQAAVASPLTEKEAMARLLSQMDLSDTQWTDGSKIAFEDGSFRMS